MSAQNESKARIESGSNGPNIQNASVGAVPNQRRTDVRDGGPGGEDAASAAYDFCQELPRGRRGDFPAVSWFAARSLRKHVAALCAFKSVAEGFCDDPEYEGVRKDRIDDWRRQLEAVGKAPPQHPVFIALERTLGELSLPKEPFNDLLDALLEDCGKKRYETAEDVLDYCRRSADPLGRIVLMIHGYRDPDLLKLSDRLCTALMLAGFLRDISLDLKKDRIYIPLQDFQEVGYSEADMRMGVVNERFRNLVKLQWKRARAFFEESRSLPGRLSWPLGWDVRLRWLGGMELLRKIHKLGYDTIHRRPKITAWDWAGLVLKALAKR
ncbi:MAG: squalene/phytoene synthase family protein [Elusimicrobia bacterium]|nr:squalene/phytoene synthase family protein [Elusimicrobiota bacterium]